MLGAVMGSFVGAMTWRMHTHRDWVKGRSECEHCHHKLSPLDLVPIFSYVCLRGKCRYCRKPIGRTAIVLELGGGVSFLVSALLLPSALTWSWLSPANVLTSLNVWMSLALGLWLVILTLLMALFVYDWRWRLLPNKLVLPLLVVALAYSAVCYLAISHTGVIDWLINIALGWLPISGVYGLMYLVSKGKWIGLGDIKLGLAIGILVPWWGGLVVLFGSNLLASLCAIPGLIDHKLTGNSEIPFGPYLITMTYIVVLAGWQFKMVLN